MHTPMWLRDIEETQIQEWRAVGWPDVLNTLSQALTEKDLRIARGPTAEAGVLVLSCCFHVERTPSLKLYPNGGFTCYGCQECGGIPEFVTELMGFIALKQLQEFFEGLDQSTPNPDQLQMPI